MTRGVESRSDSSWRAADTFVVLAMMGIAILFRGFVNNSGLAGEVFPRNDELNYSARVVDCLRGDWQLSWFRNPSFYIYGVAGVTSAVGKYLVLEGGFGEFGDFSLSESLNPFWVTIVGRCLSIALGALSVVVLYLIVRRMFSPRAAALAALALAVNRVHCQRSPLLGNEVTMVFLVLLFFLLLLKFMDEPKGRTLMLCGFVLGLATSTKYNAGIQVATMAFGVFVATGGLKRGTSGAKISTTVVLGFIAVPIGFFVASPMVLFDFPSFLEQFGSQGSILHGGWLPIDRLANQSQWTYYLLSFPEENNGLIFALFCAVGLGFAAFRGLARREVRIAILLVACVPTYLVLGSGIFGVMRFLLPAVPFVLILGAVMLDRAIGSVEHVLGFVGVPKPGEVATLALSLSFVIATAVLGPHAIATHRLLSRQFGDVDARHSIVNWMRANLDPDERYILLAKPPSMRLLDRRQTMQRAAIDESVVLDPVQRQLLDDFRRSTFEYVQLESLIERSATLADLRANLTSSGAGRMVVLLQQSLWSDLDRLPQLTRSVPLQRCSYWGEFVALIGQWEGERVRDGGLMMVLFEISPAAG